VLSYSNLGIGGRLPITEAGGRSCEVALRPVRFGAETKCRRPARRAALRDGLGCLLRCNKHCGRAP